MATAAQQLQDQRGRPLRDLRISVTDRCNFRCGYCMPKDVFGRGYQFLKQSQLLNYDEITRLVKIFSALGVTKLRLTGGEPLLRKDIDKLVSMLVDVDGIEDVAMTTNASLLTAVRAKQLHEAGLNRLNISLDALDPSIYQKINDIKTPLDDVLKGIDNALAQGFDVVKVNMVVQKNINHSDILPMVERFRHTGVVLRFIEFMDVGNYNQWSIDQVFTSQEIIDVIHQKYPLAQMGANYTGEVAKRWRFADGGGEIGVISSITQPFCGGCARARLSAIGELFTCLFATGGFDLRGLVRNESLDNEMISDAVSNLWKQRSDRYSELRSAGEPPGQLHRTSQKVEMSYIGG